MISPTPQQPRGGLILAEERDRWHVVVFGYLGDHAGRDEQSFVEFARSLPAPDVYNLLQSAEPLTEPVQYRFRGSQRRHYQKLARFPEGLLVFGDVWCSFNPIYGLPGDQRQIEPAGRRLNTERERPLVEIHAHIHL